MTDRSSELPTETRARRLLAVGSWATIASYAFGLLTLVIPPLARLSEVGHPLGPVVGTTFLIGIFVGIFAMWIGGIWHAMVHPGFFSEGQRVTVIVLLLIPMAGVLYYFGYVCWSHRARVRSEAG